MKGWIWNETAPQYTCLLSYTGDQQITLSKPKFCVIGPNVNYCWFCYNLASQLQTPLQTFKIIDTVFSTNWVGLWTFEWKLENKDFSRTIGHKDKDED